LLAGQLIINYYLYFLEPYNYRVKFDLTHTLTHTTSHTLCRLNLNTHIKHKHWTHEHWVPWATENKFRWNNVGHELEGWPLGSRAACRTGWSPSSDYYLCFKPCRTKFSRGILKLEQAIKLRTTLTRPRLVRSTATRSNWIISYQLIKAEYCK
jgi:hypothetical protein